MRYLGIDYGTKKIGLAITNESGDMAFPHAVVPNDNHFLDNLVQLIEEKEVAEVVIGHSQNLDGSDNAVQAQIEELVTDLTLQVGLPVHLEPEQFSTQAATRIQGKHDQIDASAAALILESFLMKHT